MGTTPRPINRPAMPTAIDSNAVMVARLTTFSGNDSFGRRGRTRYCATPVRIRMTLQTTKNFGSSVAALFTGSPCRLVYAAPGERVVKTDQLPRDRSGRSPCDRLFVDGGDRQDTPGGAGDERLLGAAQLVGGDAPLDEGDGVRAAELHDLGPGDPVEDPRLGRRRGH